MQKAFNGRIMAFIKTLRGLDNMLAEARLSVNKLPYF